MNRHYTLNLYPWNLPAGENQINLEFKRSQGKEYAQFVKKVLPGQQYIHHLLVSENIEIIIMEIKVSGEDTY